MKRVIYISVLLMLVGCSNDEVVDTSTVDPNEIRVNAVTSVASRAPNEHTSLTNQFSLFAVKTATATSESFDTYLDNETMTYSDGSFSFASGKHYWPDQPLNFYAFHFASADESSGYRTNNKYDTPELCYKNGRVGVNVSGVALATEKEEYRFGTYEGKTKSVGYNYQEDMLYAVATNQDRGTDGTVNLNFRHATSKILLSIKVSNQHIYIDARKYGIELHGFKNKGTLWFGADDTSETFEGGSNDDYDYSSQCAWTVDETDDTDKYLFTNNSRSAWTRISVIDPSGTINKLNSFFDGTKPMFIIPYSYKTGAYNKEKSKWEGLYIRLNCLIYYIEEPGSLGDCFSWTKKSNGSYTDTNYKYGEYTGKIINGTDAHPDPYGVMIFGNPDATYVDNTADNIAPFYKDLYIPVPEIDGGFEPGKCYRLVMNFNLDSAETAFDEDGNSVAVPLEFVVEKVNDWEVVEDIEETAGGSSSADS